jgi:hypothetical protein
MGEHGQGGPLVVLRDAARAADLKDWGPVASPQRGESRTRGVLLHKGPKGCPEAGLWECTPGVWSCRVDHAEFCYFLAGRCVYTDAAGARTELGGGDAAFFPSGWSGSCEVLETVRKVYMIR